MVAKLWCPECSKSIPKTRMVGLTKDGSIVCVRCIEIADSYENVIIGTQAAIVRERAKNA